MGLPLLHSSWFRLLLNCASERVSSVKGEGLNDMTDFAPFRFTASEIGMSNWRRGRQRSSPGTLPTLPGGLFSLFQSVGT